MVFLVVNTLLVISFFYLGERFEPVDMRFLLIMNMIFYLLVLLSPLWHDYGESARSVLMELYVGMIIRGGVIAGVAIIYWLLQTHKLTLANILLGFALYFVYTFLEKYFRIKALLSARKASRDLPHA